MDKCGHKTPMNISEKIKALRAYAKGKSPIVQQIIEDFIAAEMMELNDLLDRRDRLTVDGRAYSPRRD
jgi:hypothetical protein